MDLNLNEFVKGFLFKEIKRLYLSFLYSIEDLRQNGQISEEDFVKIRKRILDYGNNCYRNVEDQLNSLDIKLTNKE
jgi:hypothetical protein